MLPSHAPRNNLPSHLQLDVTLVGVAKAVAIKSPERSGENSTASRAFRGLLLPLALSFLNFTGLLLSAVSLGALGDWSTWQFAAMFGVMEAAQGIASILQPNIWHLPVVELETSDRTRTKLALSSILLPHWGGLARAAGGTSLVVASAIHHGATQPSAVLLLPEVLLLGIVMVCATMLVARAGVRWAETDVVQFVVRWRGKEHELKPLSIGASLVQFALGIMTLPIAKTVSPSVLFDPGLHFSPVLLLGSLLATIAVTAVTAFAWRDRFAVKAQREQQREVEQNA